MEKALLTKAKMLEFADWLYAEKDGWIHYAPLCRGLVDGAAAAPRGRQTQVTQVRCVIGELYTHVFNEDEIGNHTTKWCINQLCEAALLNKNTHPLSFINALDELVSVNDSTPYESTIEDDRIAIAKVVQPEVKKIAKKYLRNI